jgi:hypothetical protein
LKPRTAVLLGCLGVVALAVAGIVALAFVGALLATVAEGPEPPVTPEPEPTATPAPGEGFRVDGEPDGFRLSYNFGDHARRRRSFGCRVSRAALEAAVERHGLTDRRWAQVNARLQAFLDAEVRRRGIEPYFKVEFHGRGGYRWQWKVPGEVPEPERSRAVAECRSLGEYMSKQWDDVGDGIQDRLMRQWGLRVDAAKDTIRVDHAGVVERGTDEIADCASGLRRLLAGADVRTALGAVLAFYQELRYELPPDPPGREIVGLWVPPDVLVRGAGDCDSKSLAFCATWRRFPTRSIVILVPKHALVGVEATPGPGQRHVRLGNRSFVLAEPAGPAKLPPGVSDMEGDFEYVMFEPLAG